jgi:hypothetical protein
VIVTDNGSEFTSRAFDAWAYAREIKIDYIQPRKPVQNAFIESFKGTLRDDCLNMHWFLSLADARRTIEDWRRITTKFAPTVRWAASPPLNTRGIDHWTRRTSSLASTRLSHHRWVNFGGQLRAKGCTPPPGLSSCDRRTTILY